MNLFYILCLPKMCLGQQHNQKQNLKQKQIQIQNKSRSKIIKQNLQKYPQASWYMVYKYGYGYRSQ